MCFPASFLIFLLFHRLVSKLSCLRQGCMWMVAATLGIHSLFIRDHLKVCQFLSWGLIQKPSGPMEKLHLTRPWCQSRSDFKVLPRRSAYDNIVLGNTCTWAHFSCEMKCICFNSTTEKLTCVLGILADVESSSGTDDVRATICPWATAKQQVQEEHMPDSHQQKQPHGGLSGTACKVHAPLFFWHWEILASLHQAKQII